MRLLEYKNEILTTYKDRSGRNNRGKYLDIDIIDSNHLIKRFNERVNGVPEKEASEIFPRDPKVTKEKLLLALRTAVDMIVRLHNRKPQDYGLIFVKMKFKIPLELVYCEDSKKEFLGRKSNSDIKFKKNKYYAIKQNANLPTTLYINDEFYKPYQSIKVFRESAIRDFEDAGMPIIEVW